MLNGLGILDALLTPVYAKIKTPKLLIPVTMIIGYISNAVGATLSFAIVMTGTLMQPLYRKMRLRPEVLSRTLEDSCTMSAFLIPWNTSSVPSKRSSDRKAFKEAVFWKRNITESFPPSQPLLINMKM